jgi:hypothetical protein
MGRQRVEDFIVRTPGARRASGLTPFKQRNMTMAELRDSGIYPDKISSATQRSMERRARKADKVARQLYFGVNYERGGGNARGGRRKGN